MSTGLRRGLTDLACRALQATLPPSLQAWGWAVRCEAASIPDDTKALLFTLDSLCGLMPRAVASHLLQPFASLIGDGAPFSKGSTAMHILDATMRRPRALGIACVIGAVVLGVAYLAIAGAPMRYLGINAGALVIGLTMLALLGRTVAAGQRWTGGAIIVMAGALLATALLGSEAEGAARWVSLGGLAIQPSLILLPVMLVAFCRTRSVLAPVGLSLPLPLWRFNPIGRWPGCSYYASLPCWSYVATGMSSWRSPPVSLASRQRWLVPIRCRRSPTSTKSSTRPSTFTSVPV